MRLSLRAAVSFRERGGKRMEKRRRKKEWEENGCWPTRPAGPSWREGPGKEAEEESGEEKKVERKERKEGGFCSKVGRAFYNCLILF